MADFRSRLDPTEPCGVCGLPRRQHWGRRSGLDPQRLGHQWCPAVQAKIDRLVGELDKLDQALER